MLKINEILMVKIKLMISDNEKFNLYKCCSWSLVKIKMSIFVMRLIKGCVKK